MSPIDYSPGVSQRLAAVLGRRGLHYGWLVAFATFLTMLSTAGTLGSAGVLMPALEKEFGWTTAEISSAMGIRLVLFGLMGPFAAALMNRFGIRKVVATALVFLSLGLGVSLVMHELWQLLLLWGVVIGVGAGMTALVLGATVATRWFKDRRGLVMGMMTASTATGQLVFLPLLARLSTDIGWRPAILVVMGALIFALLLVLALVRDYPGEVGLAPFGDTSAPHMPPRQTSGLGTALMTPLRVLREASGTHTFRVLFLSFFVCGLSTNGLIQTHWVSLCGDFGVAPVQSAGILAVIGLFDFVGTIFSGWLSDRYDNRWLLFVYYGLRGVSLLYLPHSDFSFYSLGIFGVIYGLDWVATVPPTVKLAAATFGPEKTSLIFGWVFCGHQLGAATAAFGAGAARTELGSYTLALYVAGAACLVTALLVMTLTRPQMPARPLQPA